MNWSFWSHRTETDPCESIEPLIPLYADRMASPEEMRRVDAHLPGCERCREALVWMQATHRALAARPIALPPADLHSRIAQAIAASAAPSLTPGLLRPARSFAVRPAYAAAASLVVAGVVFNAVYPLWHAENVGVKPAPLPVHIASKLPTVKPHSAAVQHLIPNHPRVASIAPEDKPTTRPVVTPGKTVSSSAMPREQVANAVQAPVKPLVPVPVKADVQPLAVPHDKVASSKIAPTEKHQPQAVNSLPAPKPTAAPKAFNAPLVARQDKEPISVPVEIQHPVITVQEPPVRTASLAPAPHGLLDTVNAHAREMRTAAYGQTQLMKRQASAGAANALQPLESESLAYYGAIHSDTAIK